MTRGLLAATLFVACAPIAHDDAPRLIATAAPPPSSSIVHPSAQRDFDGDGLVDPRDRCPRDAGEPPLGCPLPDDDGDGLTTLDRCPTRPGPVPHGCPPPDPDPDHDGVAADHCPGALETRNGFQDSDGCPDELPGDLVAVTGPIKGVQFELDSTVLLRGARPILDRIARVLARYPDVRLEVAAHSAGFLGDADKWITDERAREVVAQLVRRGVDKQRLSWRGARGDEPLVSNRTPAGRARNRRVELTIVVE